MKEQFLNSRTFAIVGGDQRQAYLANELAKDGYKVYAILCEENDLYDFRIIKTDNIKAALENSNVVIFPLPVTDGDNYINAPFSKREECSENILTYIKSGTAVFGGKVSEKFKMDCKKNNIDVVDYLDREEFGILNGIPTAEGAIEIALKEKATTIWKSKCLISGYGKIARPLSKTLTAMGADVEILTRSNKSTALASACGYKTITSNELKDNIEKYDIVFNTVPSIIFSEEVLKKAHKECLFIDLASKPGGIDFECAKFEGIQVIWALSLPGKTAPLTAGSIVKSTIINVLSERGELW
ncbi:MAG: dipicolinate synthase subunit DpsA [Oscillospiraceae bacterium]